MEAPRPARLADFLRQESQSPGRFADLRPFLADDESGAEIAVEFLRAKEEHSRGRWLVEAQPLWYRKFTWRVMRPLLAVAVLAAVGFSLQRAIDPALGVSLFLFGAACLYVTIQFFAHLWARTDARRLADLDRRYRDRLAQLLAEFESRSRR